MQLFMFKSKIHRARVTDSNLHYEGSITVDGALLELAAISPYEKVQVVNNNNGMVFETYVVPGQPNSGVLCLNGAAARMGQPGDIIIIITYALVREEELAVWQPVVLHVDEHNRPQLNR